MLATLALASALAQEPVPPPIVPEPAWDADAWRPVYDFHARQARYGLLMSAMAPPAVVLGVGVTYAGALGGSWAVMAGGITMSLGGLAGTAMGVPYLWVHMHRSWRTFEGLDRRPAFVWAPLGAAGGIALFGLAATRASTPEEALLLVAGSYGAVLGGCALQLLVHEGAARRAAPRVAVLPTPDGVQVAGRW